MIIVGARETENVIAIVATVTVTRIMSGGEIERGTETGTETETGKGTGKGKRRRKGRRTAKTNRMKMNVDRVIMRRLIVQKGGTKIGVARRNGNKEHHHHSHATAPRRSCSPARS